MTIRAECLKCTQPHCIYSIPVANTCQCYIHFIFQILIKQNTAKQAYTKPNKKRFSPEQNCLPRLLSLDWQTNKILHPIEEAELLVGREISVSFIHSLACFTTGQLPLPKWVLQRARSSASSFNFQYPLFFLRVTHYLLTFPSSSSITTVLPSISVNWQ